ncbi:hypothetical protein M436DRAFT_86133 [Aureobasidium namibiae CBS 147.97]|uniref:Uncharacterized protein n=1 Tax=Aureobasidium namibiae CBS 147.97 TaxID=1043004 RepID=A0A074WB01_9PEZI
MESVKSAAATATSYLSSDNSTQNKGGGSSQIAGGSAPQDTATGTSQSGTEPVSGKLGEGEAGQPYDAGNEDGSVEKSS